MSGDVALFVTCLVENMRPKIGFDTIALLEDAGYTVHVLGNQVCCGQPNYNGGDRENAIATARHVIDTFLPFQYTVIPSGSCGGMLKHHYPKLLEQDLEYHDKSLAFQNKVFELSQFLTHVGYKPPINPDQSSRRAVYHDACAGLRELGIKTQPRQLLDQTRVEIQELQEPESCCGFGGTFCVKYPDVSNAMLGRKLEDATATGADLLVTGDLGCLLNMEGGLSRAGNSLAVRHFAEVLAEGLENESSELTRGR